MAFPFATLVYAVTPKAVVGSAMSTALAAVPLPESTLEELGCYATADTTVEAGGQAVRTIVLRVTAPTPSAASPIVNPSQSGSPIESVNVTAHGIGYVRPPVFLPFDPTTETLAQFVGGGGPQPSGRGSRFQAYLGIHSSGERATPVNLIAGGLGYSAGTTAALIGGMPPGLLSTTQVQPGTFVSSTGTGERLSDPAANGVDITLGLVSDVVMLAQGKNYSAGTKLLFTGEQSFNRPAKGFPVVVGGKIVAVVLTDPGSGYIREPQPVFFDPAGTGSGASATANMQHGNPAALTVHIGGGGAITSITVDVGDGGDGYVSVPELVIWDPLGTGSGASATVGPVVNVAASILGVSRVDVCNRGFGYVAPVLSERSMFQAAYLVAEASGNTTDYLKAFQNLMKTQIEAALATEVTETIS